MATVDKSQTTNPHHGTTTTGNSHSQGDVPSSQQLWKGAVRLAIAKFPASIPSEPDDVNAIADELVSKLNKYIESDDVISIANLFCTDSYWRDHCAMTWDFRTLYGKEKITTFLREQYGEGDHAKLVKFQVDRSSPLRAPTFAHIDLMGEVKTIRFFTSLETSVGRGVGVCQLAADGESGELKIFSFYTSLREIRGHEERLGTHRPTGVTHGSLPGRLNWLEQRQAEMNYEDRDPTVLVLGAAQAGLTIGARLKVLGIDCLMIDRQQRVGDNWRLRYRHLVLHDPVWYDHLPYMPFPPTWPVFTPKDKLADWLEMYVKVMDLNVWVKTELKSTKWDDSTKEWTVEVERTLDDGTTHTRTLHPKYIVQATGHLGQMRMPQIKGMDGFKGDRLCHSTQFTGAPVLSAGTDKPKKAVVVGSGTSGHDIAQTFCESGWDVTMLQRSSTCVISTNAVVNVGLKGVYSEGAPPHEEMDILANSVPAPVAKAVDIQGAQAVNQFDKELLDGLRNAGFKLDNGPDEAGVLMKALQKGGAYYLDVGASGLIAEKKIKLKQGREISEILPHGLKFDDGSELEADEIIFATGYQNMSTQVRSIFGDQVADRVGDVWGFDETGEIMGMGRPSGHPGFWFHGGNLFYCRYFSIFVALQILAKEEGLFK